MTMVELAGHLSRQPDEKVRWKHVWEFLEEYRWEPVDKQAQLLRGEPPTTGDLQWDVLLGALAEHLTAKLDLSPPDWSRSRNPYYAVVSFRTAVEAYGSARLGAGCLPQARRLSLRTRLGCRVSDDGLLGRAELERVFAALGDGWYAEAS
jgi:hypothetical protein